MKYRALLLILLLASLSSFSIAQQGTAAVFEKADEIPDRPEQLRFPPLTFEVPDPDQFRDLLTNGIPVFIAEDTLLPLVNIQILFRGGRYLEPRGKEGLAQLTGRVWRTGGAGEWDAETLDEELDFLAANLSVSVGETNSSVSLNLLSKDFDEGLAILMDLLFNPRFQESRLERAREDLLAAMQRRNDSAAGIESREWDRLIYGPDYWMNQLPTRDSVSAISRQDLVDFHRRLANTGEMVLAVSGDFAKAEMLAKLDSTLGKVEPTGEALPEVPQPSHQGEAGVYLVNKPDVNQGRVSIGHLGLKRPVEDEFRLRLANDILGGSGFTSRIVSRVRSDQGLAYSAGSSYGILNTIPGTFQAYFQSKSSTVPAAAELVVELIRDLRNDGVTAEELETARSSMIETFPNYFQSTFATVSLFARDELLDLPHEYWITYRDRVRAATSTEVQESARRHMHPENLVVLVVGNIDEIIKGDPSYPDARLEDLAPITRLPLRDPMTLEPLE